MIYIYIPPIKILAYGILMGDHEIMINDIP